VCSLPLEMAIGTPVLNLRLGSVKSFMKEDEKE
jgi:hypothetical protein